MATETVLSPLLTAEPPAHTPKPDRPVSQGYADSVRDGFVESLEEFGARMDIRRAAALTVAAGAASLLLLAFGRHINRGTS